MNKKKRRFKKILISLVLVFWAAIAVYGFKQTDAGAATSSDLQTVTIGYQKGDPFDIAKERGEFSKKMQAKGYKVVWKEFQDGNSLMQALKAGSINYARTGDTPPVSALSTGTKLTYVAAGSSKAKGSGILVKKSSSIDSIKALKGKKFAYTKGTSSQYMLLAALKKAGLSVSDITWVNMDQSSASVAFSKGKVDAWATWDPYTSQAELTQNAKLLTNGVGITNNRDYVLAMQSYAKSHTDVSKYLIKYLEEDMQWANKNHNELITMMSKSLKVSKAVVKKMVERRTYGISAMNSTYAKEEQQIADLFYSENLIENKVKIEDSGDYK
ncbi:aliphatic sulfonate ABC transporter substrate-binding protein [Companilactobacillus crustorum]|uniref:aliphatic sulfonate ABC transporter substrate-binding protein n=1 Tax=Companilactobacillus crustorum TaxID=392416 RepID=UPI000ECCC21E|nr:aliphatic sulfonate ABC transporter substrate-binding protein [Companilactobacillus crustorum]WDT65681.1 aliphatic sulfonate ABC transporter substrate-binding protein [Companilactobacillus crustorum]HCD08422.1 sulfonate ABC transporter substrate-binding protein [Lactobacillus sp.]